MHLPTPSAALLLFLGSCLFPLPALRAQESPALARTEDVIYGRKFGTALTLDVFRPAKPNGCGVVYLVSGGWFSSHASVSDRNAFVKNFAARGYTVFAVVHGSQPKFTIPEILEDVHRAVRFVRSNAPQYGVNPERLGVTGASAGGHLSLLIGTLGGPGKPDAKDPVDRESSAVQAVACFYPPTDFLNYGKPGESAVGVQVLQNYKAAFGPRADDPGQHAVYGKEISPIYHVGPKTPPCLIVHGDADLLVPIQQAESFLQRAAGQGVATKLIAKPGLAHGWKDMSEDFRAMADWFDTHLLASSPAR